MGSRSGQMSEIVSMQVMKRLKCHYGGRVSLLTYAVDHGLAALLLSLCIRVRPTCSRARCNGSLDQATTGRTLRRVGAERQKQQRNRSGGFPSVGYGIGR